MFKPSKNPQVEALTKSCRERAYRLSDFKTIKLDGHNKNCIWCLDLLDGNKYKWCSKACVVSALAWARPTAAFGIRFLLYRDNFQCAECHFSYRSYFLDAYQKLKNRGHFRFPKIPTKRIEYLIRKFRSSLPSDKRLEIDHVVSVALGGQTLGLENLQILCRECHKEKTKKDTKERFAQKGNPRKGVKFTDNHKKALSVSRKGFDSPARKAHREEMYESIRKPIVAINVSTKEEKEFVSLSEAAYALKLQESNISRVLSGSQNRKQHKGWTFRYK